MRKRKPRKSYIGKILFNAKIPVKLFAKKARINIVTAYKMVYGRPVTWKTAVKGCRAIDSLDVIDSSSPPTIEDLCIRLTKKTRCRKSLIGVSRKRMHKAPLPKRSDMKKDKKPPK